MLKKINFTERRRLPLSAVEISLRKEEGALAFDARLDLTGLKADPEARVYVEAHRRGSYMRFPFGTVGELRAPENRKLTEIDSENLVGFRVKVVDESTSLHRVVALADGIRVSAHADDGSGRISLLPVDFVTDMGEVWRVSFDADGPSLVLNSSISGIESLARLDATFFALVYPAVVRTVLTRVLLIETRAEEDPDEWWGLWLKWASKTNVDPLPPADDRAGREYWIDRAVDSFARSQSVVTRMQNAERA